jgi:hypothetical protein
MLVAMTQSWELTFYFMETKCSLSWSQELATGHILSQINPVHILPSYLSKIYYNIISYLCLGFPNGVFPSAFLTKLCIFHPSHACYIPCPSHPPRCDLLIIVGVAYKLWSSPLYTHISKKEKKLRGFIPQVN